MTSCGYNHTLFLDNDGIVWGTGSNDRSQLGTSLVTNISNEPVQAQGLGDIVWISAGNGFSGAVNSSGAVFMWGSNNRGQLCNGTTSEITTPTEINGITSITQLSFG